MRTLWQQQRCDLVLDVERFKAISKSAPPDIGKKEDDCGLKWEPIEVISCNRSVACQVSNEDSTTLE
jgi:hypothetical protein